MRIPFVLAALAAAAGLVAVGRLTAGDSDSDARGYQAGLREGRAQGVEEGRALERTSSLPPGARRAARAAYRAGYAAGANDVFGGFDGGWEPSTRYLVTITRGKPPITYRIDTRVPVR